MIRCFYHKAETVSFLFSRESAELNKKVKVIFKLRGNPDREELAHCALLTIPVEEFSHFVVQRSAFKSTGNESENMDAR
jgi:hypothetical protein